MYKLVTNLNPVSINIKTKFNNYKNANNLTFLIGKNDNELLEKNTPI